MPKNKINELGASVPFVHKDGETYVQIGEKGDFSGSYCSPYALVRIRKNNFKDLEFLHNLLAAWNNQEHVNRP